MATKKCKNGHQYDSDIYGDNCPFCPSEHTRNVNDVNVQMRTKVSGDVDVRDAPTIPVSNNVNVQPQGGATVIRHISPSGSTELSMSSGNRRLVGLLVSYTTNPLGEVYKIYEGRNIIGRSADVDIPVNDHNVSGQHLLILFREAENVFWANDQNSSNGTYINGQFTSDRMRLETNDIIVVGSTEFVFLAIPIK